MFQIISKMRDVVDADQKTKRMGNGFLLYGLGRYRIILYIIYTLFNKNFYGKEAQQN